METNYSEKFTQVNQSLDRWEYRRLRLMGKITVLKSLIASQLVYILSTLPTNHRFINDVNNLFFKFLWSGRGDKVKRDVIISDYSNGGLKMIDLKSFNKALKSIWIKKYLDTENQGKWKLLFDSELQQLGGSIVFRGNLKKDDLSKYLKVSDAFTAEIMNIWSEITYDANVNSIDHFLSMSVWYNSLLRIDKRPVFFKSWFLKGIEQITHLMKDHDTFLSFHEFKERYDVQTNFLTFQSLISALKALKANNRNCLLSRKYDNFESFLSKFLKSKKANKMVYERLISLKQQFPLRSQQKWSADCELESHETLDWQSIYGLSLRCTKITKLITFQFKFLHRRLATNDFLKKIGIKEDNMCTFCKTEVESLVHLFWFCEATSCFWRCFKQWLTTEKGMTDLVAINLTPAIIMGLKPHSFRDKQVHLFFLIARYFIWFSKMQDKAPDIQFFFTFLTSFR